jgi:hypothetical protein
MSYAGMYDPTPIPEPKKKPFMKVDLRCGEVVWAVPYWSSDPLYGGWFPPGFAWCEKHKITESVSRQHWPPESTYEK